MIILIRVLNKTIRKASDLVQLFSQRLQLQKSTVENFTQCKLCYSPLAVPNQVNTYLFSFNYSSVSSFFPY